jgi:hypothetical protein
MDCSVFRRIRCADYDVRVEESDVPDCHACLNAVVLCFNRRCNYKAVRAVVGGNHKGFAPEQGTSLLLNSSKAGIQINMHDGWLRFAGSGIVVTSVYCSQILYECIINLLLSG